MTRRRKSGGHSKSGAKEIWLYGIHAVIEACRNPRRKILSLYATKNASHHHEKDLKTAKAPIEIMLPAQIEALAPQGAVHQGLLAKAAALPPAAIEDLAENAVILVLDQVTDPHNVGAILRSAAAFGASAIIMTSRNSPEASGVLAKAASGALEHVPLILVPNLARALEELGKKGFMTIGFDSEADAALEEIPASLPLAIVLGAEGKGLRRLTRERCDQLARLDMPGPIKSLNVSNAAALALYALTRRF